MNVCRLTFLKRAFLLFSVFILPFQNLNIFAPPAVATRAVMRNSFLPDVPARASVVATQRLGSKRSLDDDDASEVSEADLKEKLKNAANPAERAQIAAEIRRREDQRKSRLNSVDKLVDRNYTAGIPIGGQESGDSSRFLPEVKSTAEAEGRLMLDNELRLIRGDLDNARANLDANAVNLASAEVEWVRAQGGLDVKKAELSQVNSQAESAGKTLDGLRAKLEAKNVEAANVSAKIADLQNQVEGLVATGDSLKIEAAGAQQTLEAEQKKLDNLILARDQIASQQQGVQDQINVLSAEKDRLEAEMGRAADVASRIEQDMQDLENKLKEGQAEIDKMAAEVAAMKSSEIGVDGLKAFEPEKINVEQLEIESLEEDDGDDDVPENPFPNESELEIELEPDFNLEEPKLPLDFLTLNDSPLSDFQGKYSESEPRDLLRRLLNIYTNLVQAHSSVQERLKMLKGLPSLNMSVSQLKTAGKGIMLPDDLKSSGEMLIPGEGYIQDLSGWGGEGLPNHEFRQKILDSVLKLPLFNTFVNDGKPFFTLCSIGDDLNKKMYQVEFACARAIVKYVVGLFCIFSLYPNVNLNHSINGEQLIFDGKQPQGVRDLREHSLYRGLSVTLNQDLFKKMFRAKSLFFGIYEPLKDFEGGDVLVQFVVDLANQFARKLVLHFAQQHENYIKNLDGMFNKNSKNQIDFDEKTKFYKQLCPTYSSEIKKKGLVNVLKKEVESSGAAFSYSLSFDIRKYLDHFWGPLVHIVSMNGVGGEAQKGEDQDRIFPVRPEEYENDLDYKKVFDARSEFERLYNSHPDYKFILAVPEVGSVEEDGVRKALTREDYPTIWFVGGIIKRILTDLDSRTVIPEETSITSLIDKIRARLAFTFATPNKYETDFNSIIQDKDVCSVSPFNNLSPQDKLEVLRSASLFEKLSVPAEMSDEETVVFFNKIDLEGKLNIVETFTLLKEIFILYLNKIADNETAPTPKGLELLKRQYQALRARIMLLRLKTIREEVVQLGKINDKLEAWMDGISNEPYFQDKDNPDRKGDAHYSSENFENAREVVRGSIATIQSISRKDKSSVDASEVAKARHLIEQLSKRIPENMQLIRDFLKGKNKSVGESLEVADGDKEYDIEGQVGRVIDKYREDKKKFGEQKMEQQFHGFGRMEEKTRHRHKVRATGFFQNTWDRFFGNEKKEVKKKELERQKDKYNQMAKAWKLGVENLNRVTAQNKKELWDKSDAAVKEATGEEFREARERKEKEFERVKVEQEELLLQAREGLSAQKKEADERVADIVQKQGEVDAGLEELGAQNRGFVAQLSSHGKEIETQNYKVVNAKQNLEQVIAESKENLEEQEMVSRKLGDLNENLGNLERERRKIERQINDSLALNADLEKRKKDLETQIQQIRYKVEDFQLNKEMLDLERDRLKAEVSQWEEIIRENEGVW